MTEVYGAGGFLLAGSELHHMILLNNARTADFQVANPGQRNRVKEVTSIPWLDVTGLLPDPVASRLGVRDCQSGEFVVTRLADENADGKPDKLLFVVTVLPGQKRDYELVEWKQASIPAPYRALQDVASPEPFIIKTRSN
jgi:hypothetical protein